MKKNTIKYNHIKVGTLEIENSILDNNEYSRTTIYNRSGNIREIRNYKNDKLEGDFQTYWPNGAMHLKGKYNKGCRAGLWKAFNDKGKLIQQEYHDKKS
tara:strand:+ start:44 stop:340 length:297 start_codon:yes stop_codon:yes gene_type:complete